MHYTKFSDPVGQWVESYLLLLVATLVRLPSGLSSSLSWTLGHKKLHVRPHIVPDYQRAKLVVSTSDYKTRAYEMITSQ